MRLQKMGLAATAALALIFSVPAWTNEAPAAPVAHGAHAAHGVSAANHRHGHVAYAAAGPTGFVDLSQDGGSGAGFYPLPAPYRRDARRQRAIEYAGERSAIGTAIASEAIGYDYDEGYYFGNGHGVFNPDDGVGTPFFAGYYD